MSPSSRRNRDLFPDFVYYEGKFIDGHIRINIVLILFYLEGHRVHTQSYINNVRLDSENDIDVIRKLVGELEQRLLSSNKDLISQLSRVGGGLNIPNNESGINDAGQSKFKDDEELKDDADERDANWG